MHCASSTTLTRRISPSLFGITPPPCIYGPIRLRGTRERAVKESPRDSFFYISDDGDILAIRMGDWKVVLKEQRAKTLQCWLEPFVPLRAPKLFHLRRDPFERADENSNTYFDWMLTKLYMIYEMQALVAQQI